MKCEQVQHHLDDFVRGATDKITGTAIYEHIQGCPVCRKEGAIARQIASGLKGLHTSAPADLAEQIAATAPQIPVAVPQSGIRFPRIRAAAAALVVGTLVWMAADRMLGETMPAPQNEYREMADQVQAPVVPSEEPVDDVSPVLLRSKVPSRSSATGKMSSEIVVEEPRVRKRSSVGAAVAEPEAARPAPSASMEEYERASPSAVSHDAALSRQYASRSRAEAPTEEFKELRINFEDAEMAAGAGYSIDTSAASQWKAKMPLAIPPWSTGCEDNDLCSAEVTERSMY